LSSSNQGKSSLTVFGKQESLGSCSPLDNRSEHIEFYLSKDLKVTSATYGASELLNEHLGYVDLELPREVIGKSIFEIDCDALLGKIRPEVRRALNANLAKTQQDIVAWTEYRKGLYEETGKLTELYNKIADAPILVGGKIADTLIRPKWESKTESQKAATNRLKVLYAQRAIWIETLKQSQITVETVQ
jgi:hypothetical protein